MRKVSKLVVFAALAMAVLVMVPSAPAAQGDILGEVHGNVNLQGGTYIPTDPTAAPRSTTYTFSGVEIVGTMVAPNGQRATGTITTSGVEGASTGASESASSGLGRVNKPYCPPPTCTSDPRASFSTSNGTGTVSGKFWGCYAREGTIVFVKLNVEEIRVNGGAPFNRTVRVRAQFTPTSTTPSGNGINAATFSGTFSEDTLADPPGLSC